VLVVGGADWGYLIGHSVVSRSFIGMTTGEDKVTMADGRKALVPVEPLNFVQLVSPRPLLMLNAKHDLLVPPASNKMMFSACPSPKKIVWYDAGHELPMADAIQVVMDWFDRFLTGDEAAGDMSIVEGRDTSALPMPAKMDLPEPRSGISYEEYIVTM